MNFLKKLLCVVIIYLLSLNNINNIVCASSCINIETPVNAAVFLNNTINPFILNIKKSLEDIEKNNKNKIHFTFFDAKNSQSTQNEQINKALDNSFDIIIINLVSAKINDSQTVIDRILEENIPLVLRLAPTTEFINHIKSHGKAVIIGSNEDQAGALQGKILVNTWNANKETLDKNKDNIMQYVIIKGPANNLITTIRTRASIGEINRAGIKTQELLSATCYWNQECARITMESAILNLSDKIEVVIANNDAMAIGAIEALQKYGFNKGDSSKYIPVVGTDAIPKAKELVNQGIMTGTVVQDNNAIANAMYTIGMNMLSGIYPLNGTNYKFDDTGISIRLPYYEYVK